ncbi:B-cell lymphoma/leukemia 10-like isoform X1 [Montipora capricornis]|uniref:B-cell lymphoma/leukemia 10-like isoform X1 n=1 Tax=Montipora capricornis TaxID=246305 RepID=UPI0035F1C866
MTFNVVFSNCLTFKFSPVCYGLAFGLKLYDALNGSSTSAFSKQGIFKCIFNMAANYPTSVEESDIYEAIKQDVLIDLRDWLVEKLATDKIITYLRSKRVLDQFDEENIRAEKTTIQKNNKLLDLVDSRGSAGFDQFCHAIREKCTGQRYILERILKEFEERKQERIPKHSPPATFSGSLSSHAVDPKLTVVVTGIPESPQVDLNNLPCPGDPGAPVPPDELTGNSNPTQVVHSHPPTSTSPPSYTSGSPPPYCE